jgi:hypothetical protein
MSLGGIQTKTPKIGCWGLNFAPLALFLVKTLPKDAEFHDNGPWWLYFQKETTKGGGQCHPLGIGAM